jgi:hypothetical protein
MAKQREEQHSIDRTNWEQDMANLKVGLLL